MSEQVHTCLHCGYPLDADGKCLPCENRRRASEQADRREAESLWTRAINIVNLERMRMNQGSPEWAAIGVIVSKFQDRREAGSRELTSPATERGSSDQPVTGSASPAAVPSAEQRVQQIEHVEKVVREAWQSDERDAGKDDRSKEAATQAGEVVCLRSDADAKTRSTVRVQQPDLPASPSAPSICAKCGYHTDGVVCTHCGQPYTMGFPSSPSAENCPICGRPPESHRGHTCSYEDPVPPLVHHRKLAEALFESMSHNAPAPGAKEYYIARFVAVLASEQVVDPEHHENTTTMLRETLEAREELEQQLGGLRAVGVVWQEGCDGGAWWLVDDDADNDVMLEPDTANQLAALREQLNDTHLDRTQAYEQLAAVRETLRGTREAWHQDNTRDVTLQSIAKSGTAAYDVIRCDLSFKASHKNVARVDGIYNRLITAIMTGDLSAAVSARGQLKDFQDGTCHDRSRP